MTGYLAGLILGLGLIIPIGQQNIFVLNQGFALGWPRVLWTVLAAGFCDSLLIIVGALGASQIIEQVPGVKPALLIAGSLFLCYLAIQAFISASQTTNSSSLTTGAKISVLKMLSSAASVSLLNPHAVLDTVGVIGATVVSQPPATRWEFAVGTISASWLWFLFLAAAASKIRSKLNATILGWIHRISGVVLIGFAVLLLIEFIRVIS